MKAFFLNTNYFIPLLLLLSSCAVPKKDPDDYYPELETESAVVLQDGSVRVTGRVVNNGGSPIEYAGFCMDTLSTPTLSDNQLLAMSITDDRFTAIYDNIEPYKRYFFRSWAGNAAGYAYGSIIYLDSISATPVTPPCSPTLNTMELAPGNPPDNVWQVSQPVEGFNEWTFTAKAGGYWYDFTLGSKPKTGIYTVGSSIYGPKAATVVIHGGFITGNVISGELVYINQISSSKWEITLCSASWLVNGTSTSALTGKFECPK